MVKAQSSAVAENIFLKLYIRGGGSRLSKHMIIQQIYLVASPPSPKKDGFSYKRPHMHFVLFRLGGNVDLSLQSIIFWGRMSFKFKLIES